MDFLSGTAMRWIGIGICLSQSAMFSGLNLGLFSVGRMRLEAAAESGNKSAQRVLRLRKDANFLLCTILWGNVSVNVLLALLSESVMAGVAAFAFSTVGITLFGEIVPQAYFSRHGIRVGAVLAPVIRFYQVLLFFVAKPTALILDGWIGPEGPTYLGERDMEIVLHKHVRDEDTEIGATEGRGALNFLALDDRLIAEEGNEIAPESVFAFPARLDLPMIPRPDEPGGQDFVQAVQESGMSWVIITDHLDKPQLVLETDGFLRDLASDRSDVDVYSRCHRPILVTEEDATLNGVLDRFVVEAEDLEDRVVDRDVVIYWRDDVRRIITGADIFGRLLQGIAKRTKAIRVETPAGSNGIGDGPSPSGEG